ncbi:MAG TPA: hypothetical protein VHY80_15635 [Stellaceae bacterium]|nr:hypothetical protein [Stellaceae bacterium]
MPTAFCDKHIFDRLDIAGSRFLDRLSFSADRPPFKDAHDATDEDVALARGEKIIFHRLQTLAENELLFCGRH